MDRGETIEDTGDLVAAAGGTATALPVDHEDPEAVAALVARIEADHGRLDVLVNDIFGGDRYLEWGKPIWEHDLAWRAADAADGHRHPPGHDRPRRAADAARPAAGSWWR